MQIKSTKYNRLKRAKRESHEGYLIREMCRLINDTSSFYTFYKPYEMEEEISDHQLITAHCRRFEPIISKPIAVLPIGGM